MVRRMSRRRLLTAGGAAASMLVTGALIQRFNDDGTEPIPVPTPASTPGLPNNQVIIDEDADGYLAVAPRILRSGQTESISLSLFRDDRPASSQVTVALQQDGRVLVETSEIVPGHRMLPLRIPVVEDGNYTLRVSGKEFKDQVSIQVESGALVFLETDKPIYKPGQVIHIRVLLLDPALRPMSGEVTIEALDAKGIKVFKQPVTVNQFGMATVDLPLSTEPNLGVWKLQATAGKRSSQLDVRVERYVLPKYEVKLDLPREWALASDPITGTVSAEYSFGKPVEGEMELSASRYVGVWEEYARVSQPIDGRRVFEVPAVGYASGSPVEGGLASVRLDVTVREQSTGYEQTTNRLVTIAASPVSLQIIPESNTFKPSLPFSLLVVATTPDQQPVDANVELNLNYLSGVQEVVEQESRTVEVRNGIGRVSGAPPADAVSLDITASAKDASDVSLTLRAGYSPSNTFIHVEQQGQGPLAVGDTARFTVASTREATNFYYEVLARGSVVYSDVSTSPEIEIPLTPVMAPESRLLVYQVLQSGEVTADYLPFTVRGDYPQAVTVDLEQPEVRPGEELDVRIQTEGPAHVGLAAVDRSVFILAENRLNLQQVFAELERLSLQPQAELHDFRPFPDPYRPITMPGAQDLFREAGVVVLTNRAIPESKEIRPEMVFRMMAVEESAAGAAPAATAATGSAPAAEDAGLAEVQRVRQFFPETWIWTSVDTDAGGRAVQRVTAPDSITTWMLRAVALSPDHGLGIGEAELVVFQPFFVQVDLPYSAIRGEEFPLQVALYNYEPTEQEFLVELDAGDWFDTLDTPSRTVRVAPNDVGAASFQIRPTRLGARELKVTARSRETADAIIKGLIVEPEGVPREIVENLVLSPGNPRELALAVPPEAIAGSARAMVSLTGNVLSQTIEGLDGLLQMSFGCGEQNMILFAPNVFITRYLKETNQLKPEVLAKAETLMLTGYQREMIYRRDDGSFSAFGQGDDTGSLWLTAFVLKTFAQASGLIYIDESVLATARDWIRQHQRADGAFEPVGFVHHQELLGGLNGVTPLTAFIAIALTEAGDAGGAAGAVRYLESQLAEMRDAYALAISAYALALAKSGQAATALQQLMALAHESENGLWWGEQPVTGMIDQSSAAIETTGYATLALLQQGDLINAGRAVLWLASQRNAYGGFGSTQDTIVALQAMSSAAAGNRADIDATVTLSVGDWRKEARVVAQSADILQVIEIPAGQPLTIETLGRGQVVAQAVQRFNLPATDDVSRPIFDLNVEYGSEQVEVNDRITVTATIRFTPPTPVAAGMVVLDVAVPTGFAPVDETLDALIETQPKLKRWELAGRKVVLYIEDMLPDEQLVISFEAVALYPVRAQAVTSRIYAYYRPEWQGESLGGQLAVR